APLDAKSAVFKQVVQAKRTVVGQAPLMQGQFQSAGLTVMGVQTHRDHHHTVTLRAVSRIEKNSIVIHVVESHPQMTLQGRMTPPDAVELGDLRNDVAKTIHVPLPQLILL